MYANSLTQQGARSDNVNTAPISPPSQESRLPQKSRRQVFELPLFGYGRPTVPSKETRSFDRQPLHDKASRVKVAAIASEKNRNCRHHVFVEDGERLKQLELPSTSCVAVSQQFKARSGDTLNFDYVILLQSKGDFAADRPAVRAVLVDYRRELAVSLLDRSLDGFEATHHPRAGSRFRESHSITIPAAGQYELRFMTFVDGNHSGSEAHLLVDSVRVVNRSGREVTRLASLSCVGRVPQPTLNCNKV